MPWFAPVMIATRPDSSPAPGSVDRLTPDLLVESL
jgi:hypothetical protein